MTNRRNPGLGFLYTMDWSHEFASYTQGEVPAHRLFGAGQMQQFDVEARHCSWGRLPPRFRHKHVWKIWQALWTLVVQRRVVAFFATTESPALVPLFLRRLGLLRRPVIVASVAILRPSYVTGPRSGLIRWLLSRADLIVVYASAQAAGTADWLGVPADRVQFLPFGVDTDFFRPPAVTTRSGLVLSVGTNEGKDFPTLLAALGEQERCCIITDDINEAVIAATRTEGEVSVRKSVYITELRTLYAEARVCVIPLHEVPYSSGQTVLLEMMATGRRVLVADTSAVVDYVRDDVANTYPAGDVASLAALLSAEGTEGAGEVAIAEYVRDRYSSVRFSKDLARLVTNLTTGPRRRRRP